MIPQEKYRIVISDAAWTYTAPDNPGAYAAAALAPGVSAAQREQLVAQHKEEQTAYADYLRSQREKNYSYTGWETTHLHL